MRKNFFKFLFAGAIIYMFIIASVCVNIIYNANTYWQDVHKECLVIQKNTKTYSTEIMNKFLSKAELEKEIIISNAAIEASSIICEKNNAAKKQILSGAYCTVAEAGNQGIKGQNAVFAVLNNRIADPAFKVASITQVVERPGQFDVVSRGTYTRIPPNKDTWEAICLYYKGIDYSNGAVYFYNPVISNHIPGGKKITAEINQHVFRK